MKPQPSRHSHRPFTLIELLVVIAIIAILAAMLLPSLNSAKMKALESTCVNQHRQLGLAEHMYIDDFNGFFPSVGGYWWGTTLPTLAGPAFQFGRYTGGRGLALVPDTRNGILACPVADSKAIRSFVGASWCGSRSSNNYMTGRNSARVVAPSKFMMWCCSSTVYGIYVWGGIFNIGNFHSNQSFNAICYDGHVETMNAAKWGNPGANALQYLTITGSMAVPVVD